MKKTMALMSVLAYVLASAAVACSGSDAKPASVESTGGQASATGGADSTTGGTDSGAGNTTSTAGGSTTTVGGASSGTGGTPAALGTLFIDNFEPGAANWQVTQGICSVVPDDTSVYSCDQGTNEARSLAGELAWTDYTVTARIKPILLGVGRRIYLAARFTDSSNWYGAAFYNDTPPAIEIRKKVTGASSTIATSPFPWVLNQWYTVAFKVSGTTLSMSVDGVTQLTIVDTSFASGRIALLADQSQASFDDVVVTNP